VFSNDKRRPVGFLSAPATRSVRTISCLQPAKTSGAQRANCLP
jgi:hypothetical protein